MNGFDPAVRWFVSFGFVYLHCDTVMFDLLFLYSFIIMDLIIMREHYNGFVERIDYPEIQMKHFK